LDAEARREYDRAYRERNREKLRENARRWCAKNPAKNAANMRKWRENNRDRARQHSRAHYHRHREKCRDLKLRRDFGITTEQYDRMLAEQLGGCAICGAISSSGGKRLHVDHCHRTGKVRGVLCASCNHGIGHLRDSVEVMSWAIDYLRRSQ
jgi:hypothetical protein